MYIFSYFQKISDSKLSNFMKVPWNTKIWFLDKYFWFSESMLQFHFKQHLPVLSKF